jgi:chemotaxis protein MotB
VPDQDPAELLKRLDLSERKRGRMRRAMCMDENEEDSLHWSLADLMTLLLLFFIMFYSQAGKIEEDNAKAVQTTDRAKYTEAAALRQEPALAAYLATGRQKKPPQGFPRPVDPAEQALMALKEEMLKVTQEAGEDVFQVQVGKKRLVVTLSEQVTFNVGEANLLNEYQSAIQRLAGFIADKPDYEVTVTGHTDDTPIKTARFPSNWELSTARAVTVARFLTDHGVDPHRVTAQGRAEWHPVFPNDTPVHKQANRRVEIALIKE